MFDSAFRLLLSLLSLSLSPSPSIHRRCHAACRDSSRPFLITAHPMQRSSSLTLVALPHSLSLSHLLFPFPAHGLGPSTSPHSPVLLLSHSHSHTRPSRSTSRLNDLCPFQILVGESDQRTDSTFSEISHWEAMASQQADSPSTPYSYHAACVPAIPALLRRQHRHPQHHKHPQPLAVG